MKRTVFADVELLPESAHIYYEMVANLHHFSSVWGGKYPAHSE